MLNAGSIHHVGPHRLYVRRAREAASFGCTSLRFDFEGIGDSILATPGVENEPYPDWALDNLEAAVAHVRSLGCSEVILLGICSGAQTAFQAAHERPDLPIERLVLINPWYFYRTKGTTYDPGSHHYQDVAAYGRSMRDASRWKRLLRGEVDLRRIARIAGTHAARKAKAVAAEVHELFSPSGGTRLSRDLRAVLANGRRISMYEAEGEPAGAALHTEARRALWSAKRSGAMTLERIEGADHTFSRRAQREDLVRRVCGVLRGG
jgi:pimeloyl-ACP methyl ester carboxylesterase